MPTLVPRGIPNVNWATLLARLSKIDDGLAALREARGGAELRAPPPVPCPQAFQTLTGGEPRVSSCPLGPSGDPPPGPAEQAGESSSDRKAMAIASGSCAAACPEQSPASARETPTSSAG